MQHVTNKPWQVVLSEGFASSSELLKFLGLSDHTFNLQAEQQFKTRVPRGFAACMTRGNPDDPLLKQVLAVDDELVVTRGFTSDPLQEAEYNPVPGLIHKYHGRVLLTVTGACAIHCRYCFRRHFPYDANNPGRAGWQLAFDYIAANPSIREVILSGGDPLIASDTTLQFLLDGLHAIAHVDTLRIHTRLPVVLPERIDTHLCGLLRASRFKKVVVLHANHANELSNAVMAACVALRNSGCTLLNQSVLLKHINDKPDILVSLSQRLFACGVLPYYLHILDRVAGAAHFEVSISQAKKITTILNEQLPGYLVPKLVQDVPGRKYKHLVS
jgi:EF-P beta-lysylation protein EpmB